MAVTAEPGAVRFGETFLGPENEGLRAKLGSMWPGAGRSLVVDSVLALAGRLEGAEDPVRPADAYLLFDLDHVFLHQPGSAARLAPGCRSLLHWILDGYARQPARLLEERSRTAPFRFRHPLACLDVLRHLWAGRAAGGSWVLGLRSGAITPMKLVPHPEDPAAERPPAAGFAGRGRSTETAAAPTAGRSLRRRAPLRLDRELIGPAGLVRNLRVGRDALSLPTASAAVAWNRGGASETCHGKALRRRDAEAVAILEALERIQVAIRDPTEPLIYGSYRQLAERAVDPRRLFFERPGAEGAPASTPYSEDVPMYWTSAEHATRSGSVLVPAQEVWFRTRDLPGENLFIQPTTNACAVGSCREEAALFAVFEAIERDAYLTAWYLRRPCRRIDPGTLDHEPLRMLRERWRLRLPWFEIHLFDLTTDTAIPTVGAVALRDEGRPGPRTIHGAATRPTVAHAAFAALKDVSALAPDDPSAWDSDGRGPRMTHERVAHPRDHFEFYALDESFERLGFLPFDGEPVPADRIERPCPIPRQEEYDLARVLERVCRHLESIGVETCFKDLGFPWLAKLGIHCVKAVTPGLYPIWFGHGNRRFAVTRRLRRLARRYLDRPPVRPSDFNLAVHPFS